jgi:hypothetical protein
MEFSVIAIDFALVLFIFKLFPCNLPDGLLRIEKEVKMQLKLVCQTPDIYIYQEVFSKTIFIKKEDLFFRDTKLLKSRVSEIQMKDRGHVLQRNSSIISNESITGTQNPTEFISLDYLSIIDLMINGESEWVTYLLEETLSAFDIIHNPESFEED